MLDTSDREVFNSGFDASLGTTSFTVNVDGNSIVILLTWSKSRRAFIVTNAGPNDVYISFTTEVSSNQYSLKLSPGALASMDKYGGIVTAICSLNETAKIYVTDIH